MIDYHRKALDETRKSIRNGELGDAFFCTFLIHAYAGRDDDYEALEEANELMERVRKMIEFEFSCYARNKGIDLNPQNVKDMMLRHSRHCKRVSLLMDGVPRALGGPDVLELRATDFF